MYRSNGDHDIVEAIYAACEEETLWLEVLREISRAFAAHASGFYTQNAMQTEGRMLGADIALLHGFEPHFQETYWEHYYALNPFIIGQDCLPVARVITDADDPTWKNGAFYAEWARPQGFEHVAAEFLRRTDSGVLTIGVFWRGAGEGPFGTAEAERLDRFFRHIGRALQIGHRLREAGAILQGAAPNPRVGVVTLGRSGHVRHADAAAEAMLALGEGLRVTARRLVAATREDQAALDALIALALRPGGAHQAELRMLRLRCRGGGHLLITLSHPHVGFGGFSTDPGAAIVLRIERCEPALVPPLERMRLQFRLTPGEGRLLAEIMKGGSLRDVADRLTISHETARSQLKAIFSKTGIRRQSELVALLHRA